MNRARAHTLSLVILGAALAGVPTAAAAAAPRPEAPAGYDTVLLPVPAGIGHSEVAGGDHSGRYLVGLGEREIAGETTPVGLRWTAGRVEELDTTALRPYRYLNVSDVNSRGVVVGDVVTGSEPFHADAWVYRNGRYTKLPGLNPTDTTEATAVNARGDIVGTSIDLSASPWVSRVVLWPADRPGTVRELVFPGTATKYGRAEDIDDDGTVLGTVAPDFLTPEPRPFVWPPRVPGYELGAPPGYDLVAATAVHNGWIAGIGSAAGCGSATLRWNLRDRSVTVLPGDLGGGIAVDRWGRVAASRGIVQLDGRVDELPGLVAVLADNGIAAGRTTDGYGSAVVWKPSRR